MTRAFVALSLPDGIRDGLARIQSDLPAGNPVDPDILHLTLHFLGEQDDDALEELHDTLSTLSARSFDLTLSGLGSFGGARLRALWVGVAPEPGLIELQRAVVRAARRAGIDRPHRRFVPHVTLARFREGHVQTAGFARFVASHASLRLPGFPVHAFGLHSSVRGSAGPVHDALARYPLRVSA